MSKSVRNEKRRAMEFRASAPPDAADTEATVRWLRDRALIKDLYARYAYGIDSADMELVRSVFHPDCVVVGTLEEGSLGDYLEGIEEGVLMYDATMHFKGNQYVEFDGDTRLRRDLGDRLSHGSLREPDRQPRAGAALQG